jgi:hypothetical protein
MLKLRSSLERVNCRTEMSSKRYVERVPKAEMEPVGGMVQKLDVLKKWDC